jgi:hypothetical protein
MLAILAALMVSTSIPDLHHLEHGLTVATVLVWVFGGLELL